MFTTVYDQDSFEPVARVVQSRDKDCDEFKVFHYHNNHLGTPQELTDECGNVVWCNYEWAWGGRYTHFYKEQFLNDCAIIESDLQPIRFQGQFFDPETSLHYNRFRYYDSDVGMFIQKDPIGLLGGVNVFAYAPNPIHWVDVLGLNKTPASCKCKICPPDPIISPAKSVTINKGSDAPLGMGIYQFSHKKNKLSYIGSTNSFKTRMGNHITNNYLAPGTKVTFINIATPGRSEQGARRVRRFLEQQRIGIANGEPKGNQATGTRAVRPEKWKLYTKNNQPDFCNDYFK